MNLIKSVKKAASKTVGFVKKNGAVITAPILALDKVGIGPTKGLEKSAEKYGVDVKSLTGGKTLEQSFTNLIGGKPKAPPTPSATIPPNATADAIQADTMTKGVPMIVIGIGAAIGLWYFFLRGK